jgi:hypothetical protein
MEDVNDADPRRERQNSYAHPQPSPAHRMSAAETGVALHNNYPPPPPNMQGPWIPPPSPYDGGGGEQRPHPGENQPPPQQQQHYPAQPPSRDQPSYGPDPSYSRQGSISAPTRSPADAPHAHYPPVNGNGNGPEGQYYQPHGLPEYRGQPQPMRYSYSPPENAPNGTHPPPGMQITTHDMMPGQQPGPPPGHYGQPPPHSAGPPHTPIYGAPYYGQEVGFGQRRKPVRAAQACDSCRQRKAKCDEGRPVCEHCKTNSLACTYRDVQPPKQDKQVNQIYDKLENMSEMMTKILGKQDGFSSRLDSHGRQLEQLQTLLPHDKREASGYPKGETPAISNSTPLVKQEQLSSGAAQQQSATYQGNAQHLLDKLDADVDHDFALPPKHFTAAQNLMEWPSVKAILPEAVAQKPTYVLDLESRRGLLRLYGCGEGEDMNDGREGPASPASQSSSSEGRHDEENSIPSPNGVWGSGQLPARSGSSGLSGREHPGGIGPNGGLILDALVIDLYFKEYMANIHILHPFLEAKVLRDMIHLFKRRYSWDFVPLNSRHASTGKRKRDPDDTQGNQSKLNILSPMP